MTNSDDDKTHAKGEDDDVPVAPPLPDETMVAGVPAADLGDRTIPVAPPPAPAAPAAPKPPVAGPSAPKPPGAPTPPKPPTAGPTPPKPPGPPAPPKPPSPPAPPSPKPPMPPAPPSPGEPPAPAPAPTPPATPGDPSMPPPSAAAPKPPGPPSPPKPPGAPSAPKPPSAGPSPPKPPGPPAPPKPPGAPTPPSAGPSPPKPPSPPGAPKPPSPPGAPKPPGAPTPPSAGPSPPKAPSPPGAPKLPGAPTPPGAPKPPGAPAVPAAAAPKAPGAPAAPGAAKPAAAAAPAEPVDPNSPEALIAQIPIFKEVSPALRKTVVEEGEFRVVAPKTVVCREGEYTADFYVVIQGMVGVYKQGPDSTKYLASLAVNAWFGEMSCMSNAPRAATVMAEADSVVLSVPRHTFMKIYGDKKSAGFKKMIDEAYKERALALHLSSVSLFRGIKEGVLKRIADVAQLVVAEKGSDIVKEGEAGDAFFLVRTGHAKVTRGEEILAWLCENSFFGEVALIEDRPRSSTVSAVDRMDLVKIPKAPFLALLDELPDVKTTVLERVRRLFETEFLSDEEAAARARAREIGTEHEVVKAGEALVIDMSKCTRCNMCVEGCIEAHEDRIPRIGKRGIQYGDLLLTSSCYNCRVPDCMLACKFGAIRRDRRGRVNIDPEACTGCALCEPACPYGTIHMQSLVGDDGLEVKASPIEMFLGKLPVIGALVRGKPIAKVEVTPAEEGGKKKLRQAVKCDLCAGRGDMACIYNCPCGAIERIDPSVLLG